MHKVDTITIDTPRLTLVNATKEILEVLFEGDAAVTKKLGVHVPEHWTTNGEREFRWIADKLSEPYAAPQWLFYLAVLKSENALIGSGGYKGKPQAGMVEIGYEIATAYRCQGFATEMAKALIQFAFQQNGVTKVQAHTLAVKNESGNVLKKCGLQWMEALDDPEDGPLWRWAIENK